MSGALVLACALGVSGPSPSQAPPAEAASETALPDVEEAIEEAIEEEVGAGAEAPVAVPPAKVAAEEAAPSQAPVEVEAPAAPSEPLLLGTPPPPPPPDGAGRFVGGAFSLALGVGAVAVVSYEGTRPGGDVALVAGSFIPLGVAGLGVGTYLLIRGFKARANFLDWREFSGERGRPTGNGLLVGGTVSTVVGGIVLVTAGSQTASGEGGALPIALWAVGGTAVAGGVAMLSAGLLRRRGYRGWRQGTYLGALEWSPTVIAAPGQVGAGVVGRF